MLFVSIMSKLNYLIVFAVSMLYLGYVGVVSAQNLPILKNVESVCLKATNCDAQHFNECSRENEEPLVRVHRAFLELNQSLTSDQLFIEECFEVPNVAGNFCVPFPLRYTQGVFKIANYKVDGAPWLFWNTGGKALVQNTLKKMCLASYVNESQGQSACAAAYDPGGTFYVGDPNNPNDTNWEKGDAFLTSHNYGFYGIYERVAQQSNALVGITTFPFTGQNGSAWEWGSSSNVSIRRTFRALAYSMPISGTSGSDPSNKVGQLGFTVGGEACETSVNYDPLGRVFYSPNMEPVEDATVALYRNMPLPSPAIGTEYQLVSTSMPDILGYSLRNPQPSGALGYFSFAVPPGIYKLLVVADGVSVPNTLGGVPLSTSVMDPEATQISSPVIVQTNGSPEPLYEQVYQVTNDSVNVLLPEIHETTTIERRDVAMTGVTPMPARPLMYTRTVHNNRVTEINGRINKPFGRAVLRKVSDGSEVGNALADKDGRYRAEIRANLGPDDVISITASAVSLVPITPTPPPQGMLQQWIHSIVSQFTRKVEAQSLPDQLIIPPRLNYLEGYAYDNAGNVLKNADVTIFDQNLGVPVYVTKTDSEGYYSVTSENLPRNDYLIWYTPEGSTNVVTIDSKKFYTQNKDYVEKMNIDVMQPKYSKPAEVYLTQHPEPTRAQGQNPGADVRPGSGTPRDPVAPTRAMELSDTLNQQVSPALLMYVAILLLLIVGAGLLIVYYLKRKQEPHLYE